MKFSRNPHPISNDAFGAVEGPSQLKLLKWGRNESVHGPVTVGPNTLRELAANQKALGFDRIALDFNHQTVPGSDTYKEDPVQVAAYGTPEVVPNDGLYLTNIQWTPAGKARAPHCREISPTVKLNANGEVTFIHSVALLD